MISFYLLQVREIVMAHEDTFLGIMQNKLVHRSAVGLQELALVTSIVSLFSFKDDSDSLESITDDNKRARSFLARIQRVMLGLMQTFSSKDYCDKVCWSSISINYYDYYGYYYYYEFVLETRVTNNI